MRLNALVTRSFCGLMRLTVVGLLIFGAAPAQAEFMGGGVILDPYNCAWPTGPEMTRARYVPSGPTNQTNNVTLNFAVGGVNVYTVRSSMTPSRRWARATGRSVWGAHYFMGTAPWVRVLQHDDPIYSGSVDAAQADSLRLRLRIRNFNGQRGCSVTVALMMNRVN